MPRRQTSGWFPLRGSDHSGIGTGREGSELPRAKGDALGMQITCEYNRMRGLRGLGRNALPEHIVQLTRSIHVIGWAQ